jgi:predicted N-acetyltransferase YhbS
MIHIRVASQDDAEKVDAFYARFSRSARMATSDSIVIAEDEGKVIGVIRLCTEEGYSVARTMIVDEEYRRKGIGKQMLSVFEELLHNIDCYGIAYTHLKDFYGRVGFSPILEQDAPLHLQKRYREYMASGRGEFIILKRIKDI